jgi:hypothetical protein
LVGRSSPGWQNSKFFPAVGGLRGYIRGDILATQWLLPL